MRKPTTKRHKPKTAAGRSVYGWATPSLLGVDVGFSRHHAHPAPSYVAATIRKNLPVLATRRQAQFAVAPMAQINTPWPVNALAGDVVPPDVDWLIGQLANINSTNRPDATVVRHAFGIKGRLLDLRVRGHGTYDLKGRIKSGFRVKPRLAVRGLSNELARLERAARSGSKARWIRAWAAASPRCRTLVWHPATPPVVKRNVETKIGRLIFERAVLPKEMVGIDGVLIGPRAADALAAIVEARRNLAATDRDDRRGNKRNDEADALAAAIRLAVFGLTGRVGFTRDPVKDSYSGPLVELGVAFDARFGTHICWRLTVAK